jgi:DNA polymerase
VKIGKSEYLVIPLYHPAAALYNGSMRSVLVEDFLAAKAIADSALA